MKFTRVLVLTWLAALLVFALPALGKTVGLETLRVHFHVPLFCEGTVGTTSHCLTPEFFEVLREGNCPHLEIETYTFDVLPESVRPGSAAAQR